MPRQTLLLYACAIFAINAAVVALLLRPVSASQVLWSAAVATGMILALIVLERRRLTRGLRSLGEAIRQITAGKYGQQLQTAAVRDLVPLTNCFNDMNDRLARRFDVVERDREQLRAILGGMIEGVVAIDAQQQLLFANERGAALLDFNMRTAAGLRFWEVVRQRSIVGLVETALERGEPQRQEFDWKGQPGKTLAIQVQPLRDKPGGAIIVIHDTSDLRRLERLRHEFVANVSHELKTPLAVIRAAVETLQDGAVDDLEHRAMFLEQIHDQAERLNNLILDLLSLARIEAGTESLEYTRVILSELVEDCFDRLRSRAEARGQILEAIPAAERSSNELRADEEALATILDNLVDNAIKYTDVGTRIRVRWYGIGDQIWIEVEDNGPGIPEEDLPRIFERFYRVDKARSRELGGTGLGLAIVKNLAHLLKGSVKVTSTMGAGTTFTVSLPRTPR